MPISKSGKLYFTDAEYRIARGCSALEYARSAGYHLVKDDNAYRLREHDSMIFTQDGRWFWNSQNLSGGAIEFIMHYENRSLPEAVCLLTSGTMQYAPQTATETESMGKKPFELPEKAPTFKRLFAYLCNTRALDPEIIQELVRQQRLYEGIRQYRCTKTGELRTAHNVVFVGFDEQGIPRSAFQRGTNAAASFKRDVAGSDKKYAFCCPGRPDVTIVSVFEAAIDAISHATLAKGQSRDWQDRDRIALGGVSSLPLLYYLQEHPQIQTVEFCLDADSAGNAATAHLAEVIKEADCAPAGGYVIQFSPPPQGKDWNIFLQIYCNRRSKL